VDYHAALLRTVVYLVGRGKAVILGPGASLVLATYAGLHVRVAAAPAVREERLARRWGVTLVEARRMEEIDLERRNFVRRYYRSDVDDPRAYDPVINPDRLSTEQVVAALVPLFGPLPAVGAAEAAPGLGADPLRAAVNPNRPREGPRRAGRRLRRPAAAREAAPGASVLPRTDQAGVCPKAFRREHHGRDAEASSRAGKVRVSTSRTATPTARPPDATGTCSHGANRGVVRRQKTRERFRRRRAG
jgi:hypothetical protein